MNIITILQVTENVVRKSAELAERDPHGLMITLVSVTVVFAALVILYCAYTLIGKTVNLRWKKDKPASAKDEIPEEVQAVIGLALYQHLNETAHDNESYIITIRRKQNVIL